MDLCFCFSSPCPLVLHQQHGRRARHRAGPQGFRQDLQRTRQGCAFRLLFPASRHTFERCAARSPPAAEPLNIGTLLLVDDEGPVLEVGRKMLEKLEFSVLTAQSGLEALDIYAERSSEICCVVLDLTMPHPSWMQAAFAPFSEGCTGRPHHVFPGSMRTLEPLP